MLAKNFSSGPKWLPGVIVEVLVPLSYQVKLDDSRIIKRHVDHLLNRSSANDCNEPTFDDEIPPGPVFTQETSPQVDNETSSTTHPLPTPNTVTPSQPVERRYPQRQHRRKPNRYTS